MSSQGIQTPAMAVNQDDNPLNNSICKLCRRQFAKYTCPTCNVPYCSLVCFRSTSHSQCSETFYKNQLQSDINSAPSRTAEERKQMMELLKRFEEEVADNEDVLSKEVLGADDDRTGDAIREISLVERFSGLDLDGLSSEDMWEMLTPAEREKFVKALEDPASELAQRLLGTKQLELEIEQPWWTRNREQADCDVSESRLRPMPIRIPQTMVKPIPHGQPLVYNLFAVCIAYSYIVRYLGTRMLSTLTISDPNYGEALRLIELLVPFLLDRQSTTLHSNIGEAITDVYSRFEMGKLNSELFALLLEDTATLMKPLRVLSLPSVPPQSPEINDTASVDMSAHSLLMSILVLSDVCGFFYNGHEESRRPSVQTRPSPSPPQENNFEPPLSPTSPIKSQSVKSRSYQHTVRKLEFYVAHILAIPIGVMENISSDALLWSQKVRTEGRNIIPGRFERARELQKPFIEELG